MMSVRLVVVGVVFARHDHDDHDDHDDDDDDDDGDGVRGHLGSSFLGMTYFSLCSSLLA